MGFVDRKQQEDDDLPGSGLHLELDLRRCPACRRETLPWQTRCPDCAVATVLAGELAPVTPDLVDLRRLEADESVPAPPDEQG
jgi:hypothetical protein